MPALCFGVERKHFTTELLENDDVTTIMYISLKQKFKMTGDCCVLKVSGVLWTEKHLLRFEPENANFSGKVYGGLR